MGFRGARVATLHLDTNCTAAKKLAICGRLVAFGSCWSDANPRLFAMFLLAAAATEHSASERLREVPTEFWVKIGIGVLVVVVAVVVLRKVARMNKFVLGMIVFLALTFLGFNWIYERSEPAWATPVVSRLADFFPTKGPPPSKPPGK